MSTYSGGCQCGAVHYQIKGEPLYSTLCHCRHCRRAHAAPIVAWGLFRHTQVQLVGALTHYASSARATRSFCTICGTQIAFRTSDQPEIIDISLASLDDPSTISPQVQTWHSEHLGWLEHLSSLPTFTRGPDSPG